METFGIGNANAKQIGYFSRVPAISTPGDQKILCEKHAIPFLPLQPAFDLDAPVTCPYCGWETKMDYQKHAARFLLDAGLEFRAVLVGSDCPTFCEDAAKEIDMDKIDVFPRRTHIHGKHYRCTISAKDRGHVSFDFWNSYADEEQNYACSGGRNFPSLAEDWRLCDKYIGKRRTHVTAYDLLACIQKSDVGTFQQFCDEYGCDEDSRKAETVYHAVLKEWRKVEKFFTAEELAAIQEIS
jgi:hypothetical protein